MILFCVLAAAVFVGGPLTSALALTGTPVTTLRTPAATIMLTTLLIQLAFILSQLSPVARAAIPVKGFGNDAWLTVIIATMMPGVVWSRLGDLAGAPVNLIMPGFVTPIVTAVLFVLGRQRQQRMLSVNYEH